MTIIVDGLMPSLIVRGKKELISAGAYITRAKQLGNDETNISIRTILPKETMMIDSVRQSNDTLELRDQSGMVLDRSKFVNGGKV